MLDSLTNVWDKLSVQYILAIMVSIAKANSLSANYALQMRMGRGSRTFKYSACSLLELPNHLEK